MDDEDHPQMGAGQGSGRGGGLSPPQPSGGSVQILQSHLGTNSQGEE